MLNKYKFGLDIWGLFIFLIVMIPNFIWFAVPAPNDILRNESVTAVVDTIGSVFQAIFIGSLCIIISKEKSKLHLSPLIILSITCILLYYVGWVLYYNGFTNPFIILALVLPPCLAFLFFAFDRKNIIAVIFIVGFTICHLIYGVMNFIL